MILEQGAIDVIPPKANRKFALVNAVVCSAVRSADKQRIISRILSSEMRE